MLAVATSLKARVALSLCYGCGLRASEVVRLKVKHIDSAQKIIRIEQSKGRKDRNVMLSPEMIDLLRWWKAQPTRFDAGVAPEQRWSTLNTICDDSMRPKFIAPPSAAPMSTDPAAQPPC